MDPGRQSTQERAWHFKGLRTSERCFRWLLRLPAPTQPAPGESKVVRQKITGAIAPRCPGTPALDSLLKMPNLTKGTKFPAAG